MDFFAADSLTGEVEAYLHKQIPITEKMGFRLLACDRNFIRFKAPLAPNQNHFETAFGGSIATLGILTGWTLLHLRLKEAKIDTRLVIQRSSIHYISPIRGDFEATCAMPDDNEWQSFLLNLNRYGKARLNLVSEIIFEGQTAARHDGSYAALVNQPS